MIRRHMLALRIGLMLGDGLTAILVFLAVSVLRFRDGDAGELYRAIGIDIRFAAVVFAFTWVGVLWMSGLYRLRVRWRLWTEARDIARATLLVIALTLSFLFSQADRCESPVSGDPVHRTANRHIGWADHPSRRVRGKPSKRP